MLFDQEMMRLLPVSAAGTLAQDAIGLPTGGIPGDWTAHGPDPLAFDTLGHTYVYQRLGLAGQSAVLLRYRPGSRPDTVVRLLAKDTKAVQAKASGLGDYQTVLFSPEDAWAIAADGSVAVVRAAPYRVEWVAPDGARVAGPVIAHRPVEIDKAEREFIASGEGGWQGKTTARLVLVPLGGPPQRGPSEMHPPIPVDELRFARVKPPADLRGPVHPAVDDEGRLWVLRSTRFGSTTAVFDVFSRTGDLVDRVELPAELRLVGFSPGWVYVSRTDSDDFEHLLRFSRGPRE